MSSLLQEIKHYPKESVYNHFFRICFPDDVLYEKITRKQMIEEIIMQYTPQHIVDVCTVKELKLLKRIIENNFKEVDVHSMPFEKVALYRKYLLFEDEIPDELKENVVEALKLVDFDQKEKQEKPILCLIGLIRSCGAIDPMVIQMRAQKYGLDLKSLEINPLFNFWTYYTFDYLMPDDTDGEAIVYYDSIPYMDAIANTRLDYELVAPVFLKPESYLSIFYNGYDDTDPDVHALFDHFKKSKDVFDSFKMERILECIETCRMTEQLIVFFPKLEEFNPKTTELFKKAIYKMPMPYLTGMTLQDYRSKIKR